MYLYTPSFDFIKNHRKYRRFSCIQVLLCVLNQDESRKRVNTVCVTCKRNDVSVKNTTKDRVRTQSPVATDRHHTIFGHNGNRYFPEQVFTCLFLLWCRLRGGVRGNSLAVARQFVCKFLPRVPVYVIRQSPAATDQCSTIFGYDNEQNIKRS